MSEKAHGILSATHPSLEIMRLDLAFVSGDRRCQLKSTHTDANAIHTVLAVAVGDPGMMAGYVVLDMTYDTAPAWRKLPEYLQALAGLYDVAGLSHIGLSYRKDDLFKKHLPPPQEILLPIHNLLKLLGVPLTAIAVTIVTQTAASRDSVCSGSSDDLTRAVERVQSNMRSMLDSVEVGPIATEHVRRLRSQLPEGVGPVQCLSPGEKRALALVSAHMWQYHDLRDYDVPQVVRYTTDEQRELCVTYRVVR
ncbi:MAG: hypothetical protein ACPGR8_12380 [Limisphaerales bacterium]